MFFESIWVDPFINVPKLVCQMPDPSCPSTPRTTFAMDGSTITSRFPRPVGTFGRMSALRFHAPSVADQGDYRRADNSFGYN
jgi:hypothetical protein